ncbi:hypothetical protein [Bacillus sp. FSL R12-0069]|uniref:hypothetical protein n=1 Tax=Bacillus sp. FSL R12-0069 TaxID=2975342 RepID=UPI0030FCADD7
MKKLLVNQSVTPITLDGKMAESEGLLQNIQTYVKKSLSKQLSTERTLKKNAKELIQMKIMLSSVNQQVTDMHQSNVAKRIIREQLQKERHEKAHKLAKENVQLTTEDFFNIEETVERLGESAREKVESIVVEEATKRETTQVMRQITSYLKKKLELRSIDDIPNGLIDQHKVLVQQMTRKKLDMFQKKGCC